MAQPEHTHTIDELLEALESLPAVLSVGQAADAVGVSATTIRRRIREGRLRALKTTPRHGGRLRILKRDLVGLLAEMG